MPRYSIAELIDRAQAGQIGYRGLRRLRSAGVDPSGLASSGVDPSNVPDPGAALGIRREANFVRAVQRAQIAAAAGQQVGAATQARLRTGMQTSPGVHLTANPDASNIGASNLSALLADYRRKRQGSLSGSSYYNL